MLVQQIPCGVSTSALVPNAGLSGLGRRRGMGCACRNGLGDDSSIFDISQWGTTEYLVAGGIAVVAVIFLLPSGGSSSVSTPTSRHARRTRRHNGAVKR